MKSKQHLLLYVLLVFLLFAGCTNYLDVKNDNKIQVPTTLEQLQALLNDNTRMNNESTPSMIENWSDDYFMLPSRYETTDANFQNMYVWKIDLYNHANDWSAAYRPIYNANFCLEGLQKIGRNDENIVQYDRIQGESLFYRAYYFQHLLWAFAPIYNEATAKQDVGIVLKMDTDFNTPSIRANVADCYAKIIQDTEQAILLLPTVAAIATQPSKLAGHALLARLYLSMRNYELAMKHAEEALAIRSDLMDYNNPADGISLTQTFSFEKYNKETIFYSEMNGFQGNLYINSRGGRIDTLLYASYEPGDLRKVVFFNSLESFNGFKGSYAGNRMFTGLAIDELFLIRAECKVRLNNLQGGMEDLNYMLKNRYDSNITFFKEISTNQQDVLRIVLLERRKQLLYRGIRFMDIKRLNMEGFNIIIKRKIADKEYTISPDAYFVVPLPNDLYPFVK